MPPLFAPERQKNGLSTVLLSVCFKRRMTLQTPLSRYNYEKEFFPYFLIKSHVPRPTLYNVPCAMCHFSDVPLKVSVRLNTFYPPYDVPPLAVLYSFLDYSSSVFRYFVRLRSPFYYYPKNCPQRIHRLSTQLSTQKKP